MSTPSLKDILKPEDIVAIKACAFFTQSSLHLNPPRGLEPHIVRAYLEQADRVQELLK